MLNTLNRLLGRAALASLVYLGCLGLAQAQTSTINVQAKADLADNVGAIMQVRLNAVVIGSVEVRSTTWQVYSFSAPSASLSGGAIDVVFTNDALINGQDRNLRVLSVDVNGLSLSPTASSVVYDRGTGAAAFDGLDTYPGSNVMPWSGAMRFASLPGAISLPSSPAPVANYEYDAQGNPTKTIQAPGVSGFNFATQSSYDKLSRQKDTTNAKSGLTQFGYNGREDLTQVTDPRNLITQYPRNGLGDATSVVSPDTGTATQTYDAAGNLKTRTDSRGVLATYSYDALNRPTGVVYSQSGQTSMAYGWIYDQSGTGFSNGKGRLTSTTHPAGSAQYAYDAQGRLTDATQTVLPVTGGNAASVTAAIHYGYDAVGNITSITYPSGRQVSYTYTAGQLSAVGLAKDSATTATPLITQVTWEPFGGVKSWLWQMASGTQTMNWAYDSYGRMVRYRLGGVVRDLSYDAAGRITAYTHYLISDGTPQPNLNQSFSYDELGRLTGITIPSANWTISYDANGNRTSVVLNGTTNTYITSASSNRLTSIPSQGRNFGYDNAGNTTSNTTNYTSTYSLAGRLATLLKAGVTTTYSYDASGQRIRKFSSTGAASTVLFVYDQNGQLLGEYNSAGVAIREYVWLGSTPIAIFTPDPANAANPPLSYIIHTDHLGAPRVISDKSDNRRWRWIVEPFANAAPENNPAGLGVFTQNLRLPGQYADQESGLSYNYFRDYDPSIGRYVQSDPIGLQGGINTYSYVGGNPLSWTDPSGLDPVGEAIGGAIGGWGGRVIGGGIGAATPIPGGTVLGSIAGGALGKRAGGAIGSAIGDICSPGDPDPCRQLNDDVQQAKDKVGRFSPAACSSGMSRWELQQRHDAWLDLASARAKRDQKCWAGGDAGHQQAQAAAWSQVGQCARLLK